MTSTDTNASGSSWIWMLVAGILMVLVGIFCLRNPFAASLSVQFLAAIGFFVGGVASMIMALSNKDASGWERFLTGLLGVALVYMSVSLVQNPLVGLVSLTMAVAVLFLFMGGLRILMAFGMRPEAGWFWLLLSGIISIILAVMVFMNLPQIAVAFLGILLGVDLISSGIASVFLAFAMKSRG